MTVAIDTGYTLPFGKHARLMHEGLTFPYTVNDGNTTSVAGPTFSKNGIINGLTVDRYRPNATTWIIEIDLTGGAQEVSGICIGSSDMAASGQTVSIQYDDGGFTTIHSIAPTVDSPIMFLFAPITAAKWRITGSGAAAPTIYNVMIGNTLVFEQPFYAGFTPARMNRATEIIGNISRTGELLGRSVRRTTLVSEYAWTHLTYGWVRANLDGKNGVIQSLEAKTGYIAWRPALVGDVDYLMRATVSPPVSMGIKNLWSFGMTAEVYSYE